MSHFTVLVIGENPEHQLQPFHEYECTGIKDEYVVFVEAEEDLQAEYKEYLNELEEGEGKEPMSFEEYIKDYYGYEQMDGKWGRYTNPNRKWDWYSLGGRWTGFFKLKSGRNGETGEPGLMTRSAEAGYADVVLKGDIDIEAMREAVRVKASDKFDKAFAIIDGLPVNESWPSMGERMNYSDEARRLYAEQPRVIAWRNAKAENIFGWNSSPNDFDLPKEEFVQAAVNGALSTFAVIKDGKWYEKGEMGWWGMVSDEKEQSDWNKQFAELLDGLSDDTMLSLYDCHI